MAPSFVARSALYGAASQVAALLAQEACGERGTAAATTAQPELCLSPQLLSRVRGRHARAAVRAQACAERSVGRRLPR